ncbi:MAG: hypothetical protein VW829_12985 [Deltaproteobacteria bacterium]|jgi:hypothetical protein
MSDIISPDIIDRSKYMTLDEANRQTKLSKSSIVFQCPELLLDCRPLDSSYAWLGVGIGDRKLYQMPDLGLLIEESRQLVLRRLQNFRLKSFGFNLVNQLRVKTGGRILELTRPSHGRIENIPAPALLVSADLDLYKQEESLIRQQTAKAETVKEGVFCLVWDHEAEKLKKLAQGLEQGGYIESAEIWCQHFRTSEESAFKQTNAPPINWLKNKKSIHTVLGTGGVTIRKEEWRPHFGISKPGGFETGDKRDEKLLEIIKEANK